MSRKLKSPAVSPKPPALPPKPMTERQLAAEQKITDDLRALVEKLEQRSLDTAVLLAQQAARHQGPLVKHFKDLGSRFADALNTPPQKPTLRVVKGGIA